MKKKGVFKIVSKQKPWYMRILAAIFFGSTIYILFLFHLNNTFSFTEKYYIKGIKVLAAIIVLVSFGIKYSYVINHHFDFKSKRYREYWSVGPFGRGTWKPMKELNRVSTFLNNRDLCEVNIWDIKNNKYSITAFDEIEDAVDFGRNLAIKLEIQFKERN